MGNLCRSRTRERVGEDELMHPSITNECLRQPPDSRDSSDEVVMPQAVGHLLRFTFTKANGNHIMPPSIALTNRT